MKVETLDPLGHSRPTRNEFKDAVGMLGFNRVRWNDGGEGAEPTPLPEGIAGADWLGEGVDSVEALRDAYTGAKSKTFTDFLPEEAKQDPSVTKYKTPEDFYKGYKNAVELVGKKGVVVPVEGDSEEKWNEYYRTLGVPEKADQYKYDPVNDLHPEVKISDEEIAGFSAVAHKHKLNAEQAKGLFQDYYGMISDTLKKRDEQQGEQRGQVETKLRNEWGKDFEQNATIAKRVVEKFGGKEAVQAFGDLGNNPEVLKFLSNLGKKISEDSFTGVGAIDLTADSSSAKNRIKQIESDPDFLNESSLRHQGLIEERLKLYNIAYADEG